mmetsp:Transcript_27465/g.54893  ORF Transcript_27465/g.54893 Transcript_27465/m.54893 type:complete len:466 (-) Transcript_27465:14-1411(-)
MDPSTLEEGSSGDSTFVVTPKSRDFLLTDEGLAPGEPIIMPKMLDGMGPFARMAGAWLLFAVGLPVLLLLLDSTSSHLALVPLLVGVVFALGCTSFGTFLWRGVIMKPPPYKRTRVFDESNVSAGTSNDVEHIVVITNGKAGTNKKGSKLEVCKKVWEKVGKVTVISTTHRGHAYEIARDHDLSDVDVLAAIGGDGTIHEVLNGYLSRPERSSPRDGVGSCDGRGTRFGFIPGGSGNNVCRTMGTVNVEKAARWCTGGSSSQGGGDNLGFDCIKVTAKGETICSINTLVFGLIGDIGVLAEGLRVCGPSRYENTAFIKLLCGYQKHITITFTFTDGSTSVTDADYLSCFINLTQYFGKGHRVCPEARLDNGSADFIGLKAGVATRGELLAALMQAETGAHLSNPKTEHIREIKKAKLVFDGPGIFVIDGEAMRHDGEVLVEIFRKQVRVMGERDSMAGGDVKSKT